MKPIEKHLNKFLDDIKNYFYLKTINQDIFEIPDIYSDIIEPIIPYYVLLEFYIEKRKEETVTLDLLDQVKNLFDINAVQDYKYPEDRYKPCSLFEPEYDIKLKDFICCFIAYKYEIRGNNISSVDEFLNNLSGDTVNFIKSRISDDEEIKRIDILLHFIHIRNKLSLEDLLYPCKIKNKFLKSIFKYCLTFLETEEKEQLKDFLLLDDIRNNLKKIKNNNQIDIKEFTQDYKKLKKVISALEGILKKMDKFIFKRRKFS